MAPVSSRQASGKITVLILVCLAWPTHIQPMDAHTAPVYKFSSNSIGTDYNWIFKYVP